MRFKELETVRLRGVCLTPRDKHLRGLVIQRRRAILGSIYWIQWSNGEDSLIEGRYLTKASFDIPQKRH